MPHCTPASRHTQTLVIIGGGNKENSCLSVWFSSLSLKKRKREKMEDANKMWSRHNIWHSRHSRPQINGQRISLVSDWIWSISDTSGKWLGVSSELVGNFFTWLLIWDGLYFYVRSVFLRVKQFCVSPPIQFDKLPWLFLYVTRPQTHKLTESWSTSVRSTF